MLSMSAAAYSSTPDTCIRRVLPDAHTWHCVSRWDIICDQQNNTCSAFIAQSNYRQEMIIAFRGTNKRSQLLVEVSQSLMLDMLYRDLGSIDRYFMFALDSLWPSIVPYINATNTQNYTVSMSIYL